MSSLGFAFGWSGLALVLVVLLIIGIRANWKISLSNDSVVIVAFLTGQAAANAGETFAFVGDVSGGLSEAIREGFGTVGNVSAFAIAVLLCLFIYGLKPNKWRNAFFGMVAPAMFTAAGSIFAVVTRTLNSLLGVVA
ncbi:hypothetical protein [Streptomyces sp. NPDC088739]|uniref:hypothetical protein n=1 Tax=Streptomyces sp. NPDC088739 TaxID=3365882 RepID=UPI0038103F80